MTYALGAVVMTCGEGENDNRRIRRYRDGVLTGEVIPCPDDTGSHLGFLKGKLLLGRWYKKKLLLMNDDGTIACSYNAPH